VKQERKAPLLSKEGLGVVVLKAEDLPNSHKASHSIKINLPKQP